MQRTEKSILFVDDDFDTRQMISVFLDHPGYRVITTGTVADALTLAERQAFDLYILDNRLPDGTGIELCHELKKLYPNTPVIFLSGAAYSSDIEKAMRAGAEDYLVKPSGMSELEASVDRLLKGRSPEVQKRRSKVPVRIAPRLIGEAKNVTRRTGRRNP